MGRSHAREMVCLLQKIYNMDWLRVSSLSPSMPQPSPAGQHHAFHYMIFCCIKALVVHSTDAMLVARPTGAVNNTLLIARSTSTVLVSRSTGDASRTLH